MNRRNRTRRWRHQAEAGYTLLELLVVLAIIALLVGFVAPKVISYLGRAKVDAAKVQLQNVVAALDLYRLDVGQYPSQSEGLNALIAEPAGAKGWRGPYLSKAAGLEDPWGQIYIYKFPGDHGEYDLMSLGADQAVGGEDEDTDVSNWQ
jgi:general secretion pathway protein G